MDKHSQQQQPDPPPASEFRLPPTIEWLSLSNQGPLRIRSLGTNLIRLSLTGCTEITDEHLCIVSTLQKLRNFELDLLVV